SHPSTSSHRTTASSPNIAAPLKVTSGLEVYVEASEPGLRCRGLAEPNRIVMRRIAISRPEGRTHVTTPMSLARANKDSMLHPLRHVECLALHSSRSQRFP